MQGELSAEIAREISKIRAERIAPFIRPGDRLLELGSGALSVETPAAQRIVSGVQQVREWCHLRGIDVAVCDHVLEYTLDPLETLAALGKVVKPGGRLIVFACYDPAFRQPGRSERADHYYSWNVQTLGNLLIDRGYDFKSGAVVRGPHPDFLVRCAGKWNLQKRGVRIFAKLSGWFSPALEILVVGTTPVIRPEPVSNVPGER